MSKMESGGGKSVRLLLFNGKAENFQIWWARFKAYAKMYKFSQSVKETIDPDLPSSETAVLSTDADTMAKQKLALDRNEEAMANLTLAMTTESAMSMVFVAMTNDWPGGLATTVVVALLNKYAPQDLTSKLEVQTELTNVSMSEHEDPATIFKQLSVIEGRSRNTPISDDDLMATALAAAPKAYAGAIASEQTNNATTFSLEKMRKVMNVQYRLMYGATADKGQAVMWYWQLCKV